ncbi:hypothetical protein, partial [Bacillus sp. EKM501B]
YQRQNKKENLLATPNRNSSPTYRWATPFTRLRKENSFGKFVKNKEMIHMVTMARRKSGACSKRMQKIRTRGGANENYDWQCNYIQQYYRYSSCIC